jgi:hypothetical protein
VQEFKLLLVVGHRLVFPAQSNAAVSADLTTQVQFQAADGTTAMRTVSLMFPANCRTVVRLMEAWYDAQVSLSMPAGRHCVYFMEEGQQVAPPRLQLVGGGGGVSSPPSIRGRGGGGVLQNPPPPPPLARPLLLLSGCTDVQPDIINDQGTCLAVAMSCSKATLPLACTLPTFTL